jgi:taurine dioxygenase
MTSFTITQLTDHTGAEVRGLDCSKPIDPQIRNRLNRAFVDHHVLVIRDQHFTPDAFKSAGQLFGELQPHARKSITFRATRTFRMSQTMNS